MRELAPDVRVVEMTAEAFGLEVPDPDFRHRVDAEAAEHIVNHIDARPGEARKVALRGLLDPLVAEAVKAVRAWRRAATSAEVARRHMVRAGAAGGYWMEALEQRLYGLESESAAMLLEAWLRSEEAEGVARAVHLARSGEPWTPFDCGGEEAALFFGSRASG